MINNAEHSRYKIKEWRNDDIKSWWAIIYVSGDISITLNKLRELCFPKGLCVSLRKNEYVYAGGVESGVEIGLIQYPPFPEDERSLFKKAEHVGKSIAEVNSQWSFTILTPTQTYFYSRRER